MNQPSQSPAGAEPAPVSRMPAITVPAKLTFAGLAAGLAAGLLARGTALEAALLAIAEPVGTLWLRALQMTILPLVAGLLFTGIVGTVAAANAGKMTRRALALIFGVLAVGTAFAGMIVPPLLRLFPAPAGAGAAMAGQASAPTPDLPTLGDFLQSLIPANVIEAASRDAILPVIAFVALFALASTRLHPEPRRHLALLFEGIAGAMMVVIGWVLALAPLGVLALGAGVAVRSGSAVIGVLSHYILLVSSVGAVILLAAYVLAATLGGQPPGRFARAVLPAQAVAISTQSSLASLPAMLAACRTLGLRETTADLVLPLAVAIFRATGPAMNVAVVIYAAHLTGTPLSPAAIVAGCLVALLTTLGSVSLPGTISFVASTGPIALAMGVPVGPLALLVAVEVLPDIMRTLGNVTMDVAVTSAVDRSDSGNPPPP